MAAAPTINEAITRLSENENRIDIFTNQDGYYLTNETVPRQVESLPSLVARIQDRYLNIVDKGDWTTGANYVINDVVKESGIMYLCVTTHIAGVFATDLAANKWVVYQGDLRAADLASSAAGKGAELVGYQGATVEAALNERLPEIGTYALLRAYTGPVTAFFVRGVANALDGGFGVFRVDASDTTSADNGGTILVDAAGRRWKRDYDVAIKSCWFASGGGDVTTKLQKWLDTSGNLDLTPGEYIFSAKLVNSIPDRVISGSGGVLKAAGNFDFGVSNSANNVLFFGIKLNGNGGLRIGFDNYGQDCVFEQNEIYGLSSTTNVVLGIYSHNSAGKFTARKNKFYNLNGGPGNATTGDSVGVCRAIYYEGPGTDNVSGFWISDNDIDTILGEGGDAIHVANVPAVWAIPYAKLTGSIYGNRIRNCWRRAVKVQASAVTVSRNTYEHTIGTVSNSLAVIDVLNSEFCRVTDNDIDATEFPYGVAVQRIGGSGFMQGNVVSRNTIVSRSATINGDSTTPIYLAYLKKHECSFNNLKNGVSQIRMISVKDSVVIGNRSELTSSGTGTDSFISMHSGCDTNTVTNNFGTGDSGIYPLAGAIKVHGNGNYVANNVIDYDSSTIATAVILLSGIGTKNIIENNVVSSTWRCVDAGGTYAGNIIRNNRNLGSGTVGVIDLGDHVSADKGDAAATLVASAGNTDTTNLWNTPLTAARAVTLSTTGAFNGARLRIVRGAGATGAFNLNVGTGPLKALTSSGQWCDVEYNGTAWVLTASGSL